MPLESPLNPATAQARSIADLFVLVLVLASVILAVVVGLLTYIIIKHRRRPGREEGSQAAGNRRLEILWTAVPAGILAVVLVFSIRTMHGVYPPAGTARRTSRSSPTSGGGRCATPGPVR